MKFNYTKSIYMFCCISSLSNMYNIKPQNLNTGIFKVVSSHLLSALEGITSLSDTGKDFFTEEGCENLILLNKYIKKFKYLYLCYSKSENFLDLNSSNDKELNILAVEMLFLLNGI